MDNNLINTMYFNEIVSCDFDSIKGIAVFTLKGEKNINRIVQFNGVSKFIFTQSDNISFDSEINFFPIEDVIIEHGVFVYKKRRSVPIEVHYNVVIDSCVSTWYIYAKEMIVDKQLVTLDQLDDQGRTIRARLCD